MALQKPFKGAVWAVACIRTRHDHARPVSHCLVKLMLYRPSTNTGMAMKKAHTTGTGMLTRVTAQWQDDGETAPVPGA